MDITPELRRIIPAVGPEHYKTYTISAPLRTHWRSATCEEYECDDFLYGFVLTIDTTTELGMRQLEFVRHDKTRKSSIQRLSEQIIKVVYGPGNPCFEPVRSTHRVAVGRPPFYLVYGGDWRGNPRGTETLVHRRPEDWVDDCATNQIRIADVHKRG
jgi:hypothetical protein